MKDNVINSYSSALISATTNYRNLNGLTGKISAQIGYAVIALVAAVESAASLAFTLLGVCLFPFSTDLFYKSFNWLESSLFCLGWSSINFIINPFSEALEPHEQTVRDFLS